MVVDSKDISALKNILISALRFGLEGNKESIDRKKLCRNLSEHIPN